MRLGAVSGCRIACQPFSDTLCRDGCRRQPQMIHVLEYRDVRGGMLRLQAFLESVGVKRLILITDQCQQGHVMP